MNSIQDIIGECKRLDSQGLYRDAVQRLTEAIASTPNDQFFQERGIRYERLGEYQMALEDYSTAVSLAPATMSYWVSRGRLLCDRLRRASEAVDDFGKAIAANPNSPVPHQHLCLCYLLLGDSDMACQHAEGAIELGTADAFSYYCLGRCRLAAERFHFAAKQFEIAIQMDSHSSPISAGENSMTFLWSDPLLFPRNTVICEGNCHSFFDQFRWSERFQN